MTPRGSHPDNAIAHPADADHSTGPNPKGVVINIQRYTVHDGPGIRTEFFLKGCPLHCPWCGNPESRSPQPEPGVYPGKCIGLDHCGACAKACADCDDPLIFSDGRIDHIDRTRCTGCMACADACPSEAIRRWGREMTVEEAMDVILRDRAYYESSGGGVTVSGGDPLMQADFVCALFTRCQAEGIHTCLESSLYADRSVITPLLECTDLVISDLKHMDSGRHREVIGCGNEQILDNIRWIIGEGIPMILRIPLIPGYNDDEENVQTAADFLETLSAEGSREESHSKSELRQEPSPPAEEIVSSGKAASGGADAPGTGLIQVQILPFMRLGEEKYRSLDLDYPMKDIDDGMREACNERARKIADGCASRGIPCIVGTSHR